MNRRLFVLKLIIVIMISLLAGCGERVEVNDAPEYVIEDSTEGDDSQSDSASPQPVIDDSSYKTSGQLPEEITKQIEIYVNEREVWLPEPRQFMPTYYYTWNDLNLDGSLELICSYYEGTGWYSTSYVYAINSGGEIECVAEIDGEDAPDLLWGLKLYADVPKEGQASEHFYILTGDVTKDARYLYKTDQVITFTAKLAEWQRERLRSCTEEYRDVTHSELVDTEYRNSEWEDISREGWEQLEEEFLKGKVLITADFTWDELWTYTYEELAENALTDKELGEALEALYISWQELLPLTESEAAETLTYYLQSLDDYYPDIAIYDDGDVIIREWPSEDGTKILHITSEDLANNDQYFIFGYYSRANEEYGLKYFSFINYYAVNRDTGEIIKQQAWDDSNVGLIDYDRVHFMSEAEATEAFFHFIRSQDSFESLGNCFMNNVGHLAYVWWNDDNAFYYFWCHGLAENKSYYIFEYWCDLYDTGVEDGVEFHAFTRSYYWGSYAVNKYNGEVIEESINNPETYLSEWNEEFFDIVNPSHEYNY